MIRIGYGDVFLKNARSLPSSQKKKLQTALLFLGQDPFDSRLHSKKLAGELFGCFSFRIGKDWRVLYQFLDSQSIKLINVGHRKDIYR